MSVERERGKVSNKLDSYRLFWQIDNFIDVTFRISIRLQAEEGTSVSQLPNCEYVEMETLNVYKCIFLVR